MKKAFLVLVFLAVCGNAFAQENELSLSPTKVVAEQYSVEMKEDSILIGDKDATYFVPKVELNKWNEDKITIEYSGADLSKSAVVSGKVKATSEKEDVVMYKIDDDYFEFEIVLNEKPSKNTWSFNITGHEDFDFFYQDTLENDYKNGVDVLPNQTLAEYLETHTRPENIIGSYAVYHKTKKDNKYKTGKAFHIYRPKLIDADKNEKWMDMVFYNGVLTITGDSKWLESAKYPVIVDPTFGYTSVGASYAGAQYNLLAGIYSTAPEDGTVTKIHVAIGSHHTDYTTYWKTGFYSDSSTQPDSFIGSASSEGSTNQPATTFRETTINQAVTAGTKYWISFILTSSMGAGLPDGAEYRYDTGGVSGENYFKTNDYTSGFPSSVGAHTDSSAKRSVYAEYTASSTRRRMMIIQ